MIIDYSDYKGWLQTDDYEAYHTALKKLRSDGNDLIRHILCWAHVRRRFYKYWEISKSPDAKQILELIKDLFELEKLRKDLSIKGFQKQRANRAGPILEKLFELLTENAATTPPSLSFGKAIAYTLDNWEQLKLYLEEPLLTPSNNIAENAIRPFVIGRNYAQSRIMLRIKHFHKNRTPQNVLQQKDTTENFTMDHLRHSA